MENKKYSLTFVLALVFSTLALTCIVMCGMFFFIVRYSDFSYSNDDGDYGFDEILAVISARFIGTYDEDELIVEAKRALVYALEDDWSFYMTADEYSQYMVSSENTYHGIGVEVLNEEVEGGMKVTSVYNNSGAQAAGIIPGDIITAVDGESIKGYSVADIRIALRRQLGDTVLLTVLRANGEFEELTVVYSVIFTDPVSYEMLNDNIGYVLLRNFEGESGDNFIHAVEELIEQGAVAFIYDVRSNNGGRVTEVTKILDFLLPEGEIFIAVDENGDEYITKSDADFIDIPAVVLVNSYSYSGAEYFAAVLSEYGYATTVGEQTTGKNRMQSTLRLSDGSAIHISTGMYLTPNRVSLYDEGGYIPDYIITFTDEELAEYYSNSLSKDDDPQLQKAIELLS